MNSFKDNFSAQASEYAAYRPSYPKELFAYLQSLCTERNAVWDCATGNGQAAVELAEYFTHVYATDASQKQLKNAKQLPNISYSVATAECSNLPSKSVNMVTVAQALHWFKFAEFYAEVQRVAKPGSPLAVWTYSYFTSTPSINKLTKEFSQDVLGKYWDEERKHVDANYTTIPFPFTEIQTPTFLIQRQWNLEQLLGYFSTWSSLQRYIATHNHNPLNEFAERFATSFQDSGTQNFTWQIALRVGII